MTLITLVAKRDDRCGVCGGRTSKNEYVRYSRATGPIHLECEGQPATRLNRKPASCSRCRRLCSPGEAKLEVKETRAGDGFKRRWVATCLAGCRLP